MSGTTITAVFVITGPTITAQFVTCGWGLCRIIKNMIAVATITVSLTTCSWIMIAGSTITAVILTIVIRGTTITVMLVMAGGTITASLTTCMWGLAQRLVFDLGYYNNSQLDYLLVGAGAADASATGGAFTFNVSYAPSGSYWSYGCGLSCEMPAED